MRRTLVLVSSLALAACSSGTSPFVLDGTDAVDDGKADSAAARERKPELPDPRVIASSQVTMSEALRAAGRPMIEAKFEPDDAGKLSLSLYPVGKGLDTDAERNEFDELAGDPTATPFAPALSVFSDAEHLTRSSRDLTLVQLSQLSLADAVDVGEAYGDVYWAVPAISRGRAGYNVYLLAGGRSYHGFVDGEGSDERGVDDLGDGPGAGATDARAPELGGDPTIVRTAKISMSAALERAEAKYGRVVEAKFELGDDGKLSLSLYPVKSGATINAEKVVFQELAGDPTADTFAPTLSVFDATDAEHLTRSARDLTLTQTASLSLRGAVAAVEARRPDGIVYWAIPTRRDTRAGYGVYTLSPDGRSHYDFVY